MAFNKSINIQIEKKIQIQTLKIEKNKVYILRNKLKSLCTLGKHVIMPHDNLTVMST